MLINTKKCAPMEKMLDQCAIENVVRTYMLVRCHVGFTSVGPSTGFFLQVSSMISRSHSKFVW